MIPDALLSPGQHLVTPDRLPERFCRISNNDDGVKRLVFDLDGVQDVVVDGQGAELLIRGAATIPFYLRNARNVTIRNFTVDWERPLVSEAEILAVEEDSLRVRFRDDQPVRVENGRLVFYGEGYESDHLHNILELDPVRCETAYRALDNYGLVKNLRAEQLADGAIRLLGRLRSTPKVGNVLSVKHDRRLSPAIVVDGCENVRIENVTLYHAGGMGVVAQCSRNVYVDRLTVCPRPGSGRVVSLHADATHFVDCTGDIHLTGCRLENQLDDPTNIHGIFWRVHRRRHSAAFEIEQVHHQQLGVDTIRVGDTVAFHCGATMRRIGESKVTGYRRLNSQVADLEVAKALPAHDGPMAVMPVRHDVDVLIRDCVMRNNRARGALISTLGKVRIEHNTFHTPGSAIRISGDARNWFESGPVEDVEICHNTFDNCNYGVWGQALFDILMDITPENRVVPVHHNIRIHHNTIRRFHKPLILAYCVDGLQFHDNEIIKSTDYPLSGLDQDEIILEGAVTNARIEGPFNFALGPTHSQAFAQRHSGGGNVLWIDGHAGRERYKPT